MDLESTYDFDFVIGHAAPGFQVLMLGSWHLFNNIKHHAINPSSYTSVPWFPTSRIRYIELYLVIFCMFIYIALAPPILISLSHNYGWKLILPLVDHNLVALTFLVYGIFAILLDKVNPPAANDLTNLLFAVGFGQQFFLLHFHSTGELAVEDHYHWLFKIVTFVSFVTALLAIKYPESFLNGFVRSVSIVFQGIWLMVMGFLLFIPGLAPKGCDLYSEGGRWTVRCHEEGAFHRAKSLVNIQFCLCVIVVVIFSLILYLRMIKIYSHDKNLGYPYHQILTKLDEEDRDLKDGCDDRDY